MAGQSVTVKNDGTGAATFNTAGVTSYIIGQPVTFTGGTTFNPLPIEASVTTIALLRSYTVSPTIPNGAVVQVAGYYAPNDGGGGVYVWNSTSTAADNGGTVIQATGVATGRWLLQGNPNVRTFGAKGDGVADDHVAIEAANAWSIANGVSLVFPSGTYLFRANYSFTTTGPLKWIGAGANQNGSPGTVILVDVDGIAFTVSSYVGFGTDARRPFVLEDIAFVQNDPSTHTNSTFLYVVNGTTFGACVEAHRCYFNNFTNCGVQVIRGSQCVFNGCFFSGVSTGWGAINWATTPRSDAGLRLWGADGTLTTQEHSFSNLLDVRNCKFNYSRYGVDGWSIYQSEFANNVSEFNWVGLINRGVDPAVSGVVSSTWKGGFGGGGLKVEAGWFENIVQFNISQCDLNESTGADVNPNYRTYFMVDEVYFNDVAKNKANIGVIEDGTALPLYVQRVLPAHAPGTLVMDRDNSGNARMINYGPDTSTNAGIQIYSPRSDGTSSNILASMDASGNVTLGKLVFRSNSSTPVGGLAPAYVGELYLDTSTTISGTKTWWISTGLTTADWKPVTPRPIVAAGNPVTTGATPEFIGQVYINTSLGDVYISKATSSPSDFVSVGP